MISMSYDALPTTHAARARLDAAFAIRINRTPRESWRDWRGHRIHLDTWAPDVPPRATVILVHGAGGHGRLLAPFAAPLADAGYRVLAPDLPGYGLTQLGETAADYATWPALIADLAGEATADGPVFLFGLSVGGLTAVFAAQHEPRVTGVIATTLIDPRERATFLHAARRRWLGWLALAAFRLGRVGRGLALPLAWTMPIETLTTDPALARLLVRDPLLGRRRVPLGFFRSLYRYRAPRADLALACPLLLVHPGADAWTPTAMSRALFEQVPGPKRMIELTNGAHTPLESPAYGELLAAVLAFLADGALTRSGPAGSRTCRAVIAAPRSP